MGQSSSREVATIGQSAGSLKAMRFRADSSCFVEGPIDHFHDVCPLIEHPKSGAGIEAATRGKIWNIPPRILEADIGAVETTVSSYVSSREETLLPRMPRTRILASSTRRLLAATSVSSIAIPENPSEFHLRRCFRWRAVPAIARRLLEKQRARYHFVYAEPECNTRLYRRAA
jgi:hypothetical protein